MAGPLPEHRTPSKPLVVGGITFYKHDKYGNPVTRWLTKPGGTYVNGRCVDWQHFEVPVPMHVLDYSPELHRPSKNARGRTRPRTRAESIRMRGLQRRAAQFSKSSTVDANRLAAALV